jgi:hypothetical protein
MFGVFRVKNHDYTPKNHIFSNFRGDARRVRPPPPLDPPLKTIGHCRSIKSRSNDCRSNKCRSNDCRSIECRSNDIIP